METLWKTVDEVALFVVDLILHISQKQTLPSGYYSYIILYWNTRKYHQTICVCVRERVGM